MGTVALVSREHIVRIASPIAVRHAAPALTMGSASVTETEGRGVGRGR